MDELDELYNWIKSQHFIVNEELVSQEDINEAYDALIQQFQVELNAKYVEKLPKRNKSLIRREIRDFYLAQSKRNTDRLQSENLLLTSELQMDLLTCKKEIVMVGYDRPLRISNNKSQYNFSYLTKGSISQNDKRTVVYFVNTIQFVLENSKKTLASSVAKKETINLDSIVTRNRISAIEEVVMLADRVEDFSFHQFVLPFETFDEAVLLFRYDHTNSKHYNCKPQNLTMPLLYKEVYPDFVEDPHFHFATTFGNIYKLNKHNEDYNYGVGYAIGVSDLLEYLEKLEDVFLDKKEIRMSIQSVLTENDFGMPFLHNVKRGITSSCSGLRNHKKICRAMRKLDRQIKSGIKSAELALVVDIAHAFTNTENLNLSREFLNNDDMEINH